MDFFIYGIWGQIILLASCTVALSTAIPFVELQAGVLPTKRKFFHVINFSEKLNFLKLRNVFKLELAEIMHKLFSNKTPNVFKTNL